MKNGKNFNIVAIMKKIMRLFVFVATVAMALASCQKNEINDPTPQEVEYKFLLANAETKATVGETCVEWATGDWLGSFTNSNNGYSKITVTDGLASFSVYSSGGLSVGDKIYFYYPYDSEAGSERTAVSMSISTTQNGVDNMPMASLPFTVTTASEDNQTLYAGEIKMANLGSVIEFNVYTETAEYVDEIIESVAFEANENIAGAFTFDLTEVDYSNIETLAISGYGEKTVVVSASENLVVGTKEAPAVLKMVVAPGSYTGNVVVKTNAATYTFPIASAKEFSRSAIKPLGLKLREDVREENASREVTISFATTDQRVSQSGDSQVWENDGITFINTKANSTNAVVGNVNPVRLYKNSNIKIEAPGYITKIEFNSATGDYFTNLKTLLPNASVSGQIVTEVYDGSSTSVLYSLTTGQVRLNSITVTYSVSGETPDQPSPEDVILSSIEVSEPQTEYTVGDSFDEPTVTAKYSDNSTKEVDATFSGYNMNEAGTYTVNVSYTEDDVTVETSYDIVVKAKDPVDVVAHTVTWDLSKDETSEATESKIAWDSDGVSMVNSKGTAQPGANNYYPGVDNRTSTRFYNGNTLTISPKTGYAIESVVFTATTTNYATAFKGSTWTNAAAVVSEMAVTLNPEDGRDEISANITGTCGFTKVVVNLVPAEGYVKPVVVLSSIAVSGQTTSYTVEDTFTFDGTVTATYSNGSTNTVNPTSVSAPDMTTEGTKEVTVTYTEDEVTKTATYTITVSPKATEPEQPEEPETTPKFVKVTSEPTDWSGTYLIVYESGNVAFDGSRTTMDAASNTKTVTISNGEIEANDAMMSITFDIAKNGTVYTIKSKSGYYIGNNSDSNSLTSSTSTKYDNTITLNTDKSVQIVGKGKSVLRYNATSGQTRFRYFKSSTYTNQKAIHLYKLAD